MVGDRDSGEAVIIDPRRDVDIYISTAAAHGLSIKHVVLTHIHADFIAGHLELNARTGSLTYLGKEAKVSFPFVPLADGSSINLGNVRLEVIETPGHTLESICLLASQNSNGEQIKALFTGDTLFVGDVGRPDLLVSSGVSAEELAGMLFHSLTKLKSLPENTLVYPGHGHGSLCGRQISIENFSTLGRQLKFNPFLRYEDKEEFVTAICSHRDAPPAYFFYDAGLNKTERPLLEDALHKGLQAITLSELISAKESGAQLLDVRAGDQFSSGHIEGALNVALAGQFASWAGTILDTKKPVYVLSNCGQEQEAALRLARIGIQVEGYFNYEQDQSASTFLRRYPRVNQNEFEKIIVNEPQALVLDVRSPDEHKKESIPGSRNIPLSELAASTDMLACNQPIVVYCANGYRSSIAASLLMSLGYQHIYELSGGMADFW